MQIKSADKIRNRGAEGGRQRFRCFFIGCVFLLCAAAIFIFLKSTPSGVGLVSDSVNYLNGARMISEGRGYARLSGNQSVKPITNFPPLYSIILSGFLFAGLDAAAAAWWVALIFYLLNLITIVILIGSVSDNRWVGLLGGILFLVSKPFLYFQVFAMSESVFFFTTLWSFFFLWRGLDRDRAFDWLMSGAFAGWAFLTRYAGAASLGAALAAILMIAPCQVRKFRALGQCLLGALPWMAGWLVRNQLVAGNTMNRATGVHLLGFDDFQTGVLIFWKWLNPLRYGELTAPVPWMRVGVLLFAVLAAAYCLAGWILTLRGREIPDRLRFVWAGLVYCFGYLALVYLTISFLDASVNIEERILYPLWMVLPLIAIVLSVEIFSKTSAFVRAVPILIWGIFTVIFASETAVFVPKFSSLQYGWAWSGWRDSPAMNLIQSLPAETVIYSNQQEAVSFWTGRGSYALLDPIDPSSDAERPGYAETQTEIRRQVLSGEAILVFFQVGDWLDPAGGENWVTRLTEGLPVIYQDESEWVIGTQ